MPNLFNINIFGQRAPLAMPLVSSFGYFDGDPLPDPYIPDIVERCLALVVEQFESSDTMLSMFSDILTPGQEIEFTLWDLMQTKNIASVTGDRLDIIGAIVGEERNFRDDETYRTAIYSRILLNRSSGQPEMLLMGLKILTNFITSHYQEIYPGKVYITFSTIYTIPSSLPEELQKLAPAGVQLFLQYLPVEEPYFAFASDAGFPQFPNTKGFSEHNYLESGKEIGGMITELITI